MRKIACFCLTLAAATPLWSQVEPSAFGGYDLDSEHMMTPPPVSRAGYPATAGSEERTNFLAGGLVFTAAYTDNLMLLSGNGPISDETYSFLPTISLDRRTARDGESLHYSSGYTLYQNTSQLNALTQDGSADFRYHFSPYAVLIFSDSFGQNNNLYNQRNPFTGAGISGAPGSSNTVLIEPFADELTNSTNAAIEYQFVKNTMVGASGSYSFLQFSGHSYLPALSNQDTAGANAFFSQRFGRSYAGVTYQVSKSVTHPISSYTLSNTAFGFYTHYFTRTISISLLGGPEHYTSGSELKPKSSAWTPAVQGSVGWQVLRANLAANFAHVVSGAGGLIGTFHSDTGSLTGQLMFSRTWTVGAHAEYSHYRSITSNLVQFAYPGGDTISGGVDLQHSMTQWLSLEAGYQHLHQNYAAVTVSNSLQDSNRATVSISYQFSRPLGR